eukprot:10543647-Lingulodinium_polyedra.AAC.1
MDCATVRFASRCGDGSSIRPHCSATLAKRCTTMRSDRPSRTSCARQNMARAWRVQTCHSRTTTAT